MKIQNIGNYSYRKIQKNSSQKQNPQIHADSLSFKGWADCAVQKLSNNIYFIRMDEYKQNEIWGAMMIAGTYKIAQSILEKADFQNIVSSAEQIVINAYKIINDDLYKSIYTKDSESPFSVFCIPNKGWEYYDVYSSKFTNGQKTFEPKSNKEYKDACVNKFYKYDNYIIIEEGWDGKKDNLALAKKEFKKLYSPSLMLTPKKLQEKKINRIAATIQWLIAQESPWQRGNDSIASLITKSIYLAKGMEITPVKAGKSLDFEAWHQDLEEYIKNYPNLFEKPPKKIHH